MTNWEGPTRSTHNIEKTKQSYSPLAIPKVFSDENLHPDSITNESDELCEVRDMDFQETLGDTYDDAFLIHKLTFY